MSASTEREVAVARWKASGAIDWLVERLRARMAQCSCDGGCRVCAADERAIRYGLDGIERLTGSGALEGEP